MRVPIGYINTLVSDTICDGYSREAHVDQQADMAMSDPVNPYSLHSAGCTSAAHFMMQVGFCEPEYSVSFFDVRQSCDIPMDFLHEKVWHQYTADTFICFRWGNDIFALDALIRLCNMNDFVFKIEIGRCKCQKFSQTKATPIQGFKCHI